MVLEGPLGHRRAHGRVHGDRRGAGVLGALIEVRSAQTAGLRVGVACLLWTDAYFVATTGDVPLPGVEEYVEQQRGR